MSGSGAPVWAGMMGHMIRLFLPCMQIVHLLAQSHLVGGEMSSCARVQIKEQAAALGEHHRRHAASSSA